MKRDNLTNADILERTSHLAYALDTDQYDPIKVKAWLTVFRTNMQAMGSEVELFTRLGVKLKDRHRKYYGLDEAAEQKVRDVSEPGKALKVK